MRVFDYCTQILKCRYMYTECFFSQKFNSSAEVGLGWFTTAPHFPMLSAPNNRCFKGCVTKVIFHFKASTGFTKIHNRR